MRGMRELMLVAGVAGLVGCGTVANGVKQDVEVTSDPPGARFVVSPSGVTGVTPATIQLERKYDYTVRLSLPGYRDRKAYMRRTVSGSTQNGNVASCLVLPWICMAWSAVDEKNGGQFDLVPSPLSVTLTPDDGTLDAETESRVSFFNANPHAAVTFTIDGGEECKLAPGKFARRVLSPGTHHVEAFHWDVFKMTGTSDIEIDGPEQFVAIFATVYSTRAAPVNELPEGFAEDCIPAHTPSNAPPGIAGDGTAPLLPSEAAGG